MQRRHKPGKRPPSFLRWLGWLAGLILIAGAVLVLLAPTLVTRYIRAYLQQDDFRLKAEELISTKIGGRAQLAPLVWHDATATAADLSLDTPGWSVDAGGLRASLDFGAIRQGTWSIQAAGADDVTLRHTPAAPIGHPAAADAVKFDTSNDGIPAFLRRYIPTKTTISGFEVRRFLFEQGGWKIADAQLRLGNWRSGEVSVSAKLNGGSLHTPISAPQQKEPLKLDITRATLRVDSRQLQLSDATLRWKQGAEATVRGSWKVETGAWQTSTQVRAVPLEELLDPWWKQRLTGRIEGDLEMSGIRNAPPAWKADVALKDGALAGLPILDKLVTYTHTHRFKRLVLDLCSATVRPQGDTLRIENIIVQSNGLLHIEGTLNIRGRNVDGDFMLGVTPETLVAIPGAGSRVFVETNPAGPPGMQWAHLRIAGTLDAPQEDLSSRLIGAAGMSLLLDTPGALVGQGAAALLTPVLGGDAAKMPGKALEDASGLLQNGVKAGSGILNQVLPVFPGK